MKNGWQWREEASTFLCIFGAPFSGSLAKPFYVWYNEMSSTCNIFVSFFFVVANLLLLPLCFC